MKRLICGLVLMASVAMATGTYDYAVRIDTQFPARPLPSLSILENAEPIIRFDIYNNNVSKTVSSNDVLRLFYGTGPTAEQFVIVTNTSTSGNAFYAPMAQTKTATNGVFWYSVIITNALGIYYSGTGTLTLVESTIIGAGALELESIIDYTKATAFVGTAADGPVRADGTSITAAVNADGSITLTAPGAGTMDHTALSNLDWTASGHTGTAARLAGFFEGGAAGYAGFGPGMYLDGSDNIAVSNAVLTQAANGQTAYGWGNHATNGYLTAYSETDPIWSAVSNTVTTGAAAGATAVQPGDLGDLALLDTIPLSLVTNAGTMAAQAANLYGPLASANTWANDNTFSKQVFIGEHPDFPLASTTAGNIYVDGGTLYLKAPEPSGSASLTVSAANASHNGTALVKASRTITVNGVSGTLASNVTFTVSESDTLQSVATRGASITNTIASTAAVPITWGGTNTFLARTGTISGTNSLYWTVSGTNYHLRIQ